MLPPHLPPVTHVLRPAGGTTAVQASVAVSRGVRSRVPCAAVLAKRAVRVSVLAIRIRATLLVDEATGSSARNDEGIRAISGCVGPGGPSPVADFQRVIAGACAGDRRLRACDDTCQ